MKAETGTSFGGEPEEAIGTPDVSKAKYLEALSDWIGNSKLIAGSDFFVQGRSGSFVGANSLRETGAEVF